jgi:hypothetical protein
VGRGQGRDQPQPRDQVRREHGGPLLRPRRSPKDPSAERPLLDLEANFEVTGEDGKVAIRWAPQTFELYLIDQPLPLFQTLQKQDEKGTVLSTEKKPLGPGKYTLVATVTDKVSGKKGEAKMPFAVI